jgi:hypothetical protein
MVQNGGLFSEWERRGNKIIIKVKWKEEKRRKTWKKSEEKDFLII